MKDDSGDDHGSPTGRQILKVGAGDFAVASRKASLMMAMSFAFALKTV